MEIALILMAASGILVVTAIEIVRCVNPRFRKWLESEGWDV